MPKKSMKKILLMAMSVALCCCTSEKRSESTEGIPGFETSVLTFDTTGHFLGDTLNPQFMYSYNITLPNEGISPCADSVRLSVIAAAMGTRSNDIEASRKEMIKSLAVLPEDEVAALKEMFSAQDTPYEVQCNANCVFENGDIYNSFIKSYSYMGGAHGFSAANFNVWDKLTAKKLTVEDIFVEDSESKLTEMILDSLCKIMDVKSHDQLTDAGIFDVKEVTPNNNIRINGDSLIFNYNQYEIAAYAVGPIAVSFSLSDLKPLLRGDSPIYKLAE